MILVGRERYSMRFHTAQDQVGIGLADEQRSKLNSRAASLTPAPKVERPRPKLNVCALS